MNVVENTTGTVHITIPITPDNQLDLSDNELLSAAGGLVSLDGPCGPSECPNPTVTCACN